MKGHLVALLLFGAAGCAAPRPQACPPLGPAAVPGYVGSRRCGACHEQKYADWSRTRHASFVRDARAHPEAVLGDLSDPGLPFRASDVDLVIGDDRAQRYAGCVDGDYYAFPEVWLVQERRWRRHGHGEWSWRRTPYSTYCQGCHATGYRPESRAFAEWNIGCEACHGPGEEHARTGSPGAVVNPAKLPTERRDMICAACHLYGADPSGRYRFPAGYVPGADLAEFYVPVGTEPDEPVPAALARLEAKWRSEYGRIDLCGDDSGWGPVPDDLIQRLLPVPNELCTACHGWAEDPRSRHSRHSGPAVPRCTSCHRPTRCEVGRPVGATRPTLHHAAEELAPECVECHGDKGRERAAALLRPSPDVHAPGTHAAGAFDPDVAAGCSKCHADKSAAWAADLVRRWNAEGTLKPPPPRSGAK